MIIRNLFLPFLSIMIFLSGCASHPPVFPQMPVKGQTNAGFSFAVENVIPVIWWRHGINKYTDIGFKLGIPISGTGVDINRILSKREHRWDVLNIAYNFSPNSGFDFTYYMFKGNKRKGEINPYNIGWTGFRSMIIPDGSYENPGPGNDRSVRFGFLIGRRFSYRWGFEAGYFHDPRAGFKSDNTDYPHKNPDNKWPTQFSKGAGVSAQLFLYLGPTKKNK